MEVTSEHLKQLNNLILNKTYTKKDEMVPNGNGIWDKMNGLFGSQLGHFEQLQILNTIFGQFKRITRIKTDQNDT